MNADQTYNTIVFKKTFDNESKGERKSITRGVNTPDVLTVQSQAYIDAATKIGGNRSTVRVDLVNVTAGGVIYTVSAYTVIAMPELSTATDMSTILTTYRAVVAASGILEAVCAGEK